MSHHAICPTCLSNFQSFDENPQNLSNFTGPVGVGFGCRQPLFLTFVCRVDAAKQEDERQRRATSRTTSSIAPFAPFTQTALCVVETDSCVVSFICPIPTCARPKDQFGQKSIWTSACPKICPSPICTSSLLCLCFFLSNIHQITLSNQQPHLCECLSSNSNKTKQRNNGHHQAKPRL